MKFYYLFFGFGMSINGPFDSELACRDALIKAVTETPATLSYDVGHKAGGICFQGNALFDDRQ